MPRAVYGILTIHRSHRIESPDPRRDGETGRPHACTTCHLDRSLIWSAREMRRIWGDKYAPPAFRADGAAVDLPDAVASLLGGDAVQRAVYAWAAGRADAVPAAPDRAPIRAALAVTLADAYPSVRRLAQESLLGLERELALGHDRQLLELPIEAEGRQAAARAVLEQIARLAPRRLNPPAEPGILTTEFAPRMEAIQALLALQDDRVIWIGE
jgi:hypothetical protein